jgi:hypothetical protein
MFICTLINPVHCQNWRLRKRVKRSQDQQDYQNCRAHTRDYFVKSNQSYKIFSLPGVFMLPQAKMPENNNINLNQKFCLPTTGRPKPAI